MKHKWGLHPKCLARCLVERKLLVMLAVPLDARVAASRAPASLLEGTPALRHPSAQPGSPTPWWWLPPGEPAGWSGPDPPQTTGLRPSMSQGRLKASQSYIFLNTLVMNKYRIAKNNVVAFWLLVIQVWLAVHPGEF